MTDITDTNILRFFSSRPAQTVEYARVRTALETCHDALFTQYSADASDEALVEVLEAAVDRLTAEATALLAAEAATQH